MSDMTYNPYDKQTWANYPETTSPLNGLRLNHIESGIKDNNTYILDLDSRVQALESMNAAEGSSF